MNPRHHNAHSALGTERANKQQKELRRSESAGDATESLRLLEREGREAVLYDAVVRRRVHEEVLSEQRLLCLGKRGVVVRTDRGVARAGVQRRDDAARARHDDDRSDCGTKRR